MAGPLRWALRGARVPAGGPVGCASEGGSKEGPQKGNAEPRGQGGCRKPRCASWRAPRQRRSGRQAAGRGAEPGREPRDTRREREGAREEAGTQAHDNQRHRQPGGSAERGRGGIPGPRRGGGGWSALGVWSGHTAFPGLGGGDPERQETRAGGCLSALRPAPSGAAGGEVSSTHGNNEPLPSQQISFIDLDVTEVFHPTLADLFKLLLVDKAQRGVTWGKAPRVTPPDSLKLGRAPTPPRGISQRGCTALAWEGHPERRPQPTPQPQTPHLGEAQPRGTPSLRAVPERQGTGPARTQAALPACSGEGAG